MRSARSATASRAQSKPLGDAVFVFAAHVERGGNAPRVEIATCLEDALGWLCAAIACTDVLAFAGLSDAPAD